jgi:hypothetical protein
VQQPCFGYFFLASGSSQWLWQEAQLPLQPSPFQPPCLEIQTTASANSTANITSVMIPRSVSIFIPRFLLCSFLPPSIHDLQAKSNSLPHIFLCRAQQQLLPGGNVARPEHGMAFLQPEKRFRKK